MDVPAQSAEERLRIRKDKRNQAQNLRRKLKGRDLAKEKWYCCQDRSLETKDGFSRSGIDYRGNYPWVLDLAIQLYQQANEEAEDVIDTARFSLAYRMAAERLDALRKKPDATKVHT